MSYLVDSDWLIDALVGVAAAVEPLERHASDGLAVSIVAFGELYEGAYDLPDPRAHLESLHRFLSGFAVLGLTDPIMQLFGQHRSVLRRQGNLIPDLDLLIGATALHHGLTVMTRNVGHFSRIPGLKLYQTRGNDRR